MIKKTLILITLFVFQQSFCQFMQLSSKAEVSFITAGPGNVLYEGFGHSTIRIKDSKNGIDWAYNYGVFDFNAPHFYINFLKGKMLYKLQRYPFYLFLKSYNNQKRWVKEQILNLTQQQKQAFFNFLENNAKPENASYYYDPFYNNCATKPREITDFLLKNKVVFYSNHLKKQQSFRMLLNEQIPWNTWGGIGINLALGSKLDRIATPKEHMYLPDFVLAGFNDASIYKNGQKEPLVKKEHTLLKYKEQQIQSGFFSPIFIFCVFALLGIFITYRDCKREKQTKWLDVALLFSTGFIGVLVNFMWFFTSHSMAPNNFNVLWAFAPNLLVAFLITKKTMQKWSVYYFMMLLVFLICIPILWIAKIQLFPRAIIPILVLLFIRYFWLAKLLLSSKK